MVSDLGSSFSWSGFVQFHFQEGSRTRIAMTQSVSKNFYRFFHRKSYLNILVTLSAWVGFDHLNVSAMDRILQLLQLFIYLFKRYSFKDLISWFSSLNSGPEHLPLLSIDKARPTTQWLDKDLLLSSVMKVIEELLYSWFPDGKSEAENYNYQGSTRTLAY